MSGKINASAAKTLQHEAERTMNEVSNLVASIKFYCRKNAFRDTEAPVTEAALLEKAEAAKAAVAQAKMAIEAHAASIV